MVYFFKYTFKKFPSKVGLFVLAKIGEFAFQLAVASVIAVFMQSFLGMPSVGEGSSLIRTYEKFRAIVTSAFNGQGLYVVLVLAILGNALVAYVSRRILTRISVEAERELSAEVLCNISDIDYPRYANLTSHFGPVDTRFILRIIQQNTRLVGIICRNLIAALFSILQLLMVLVILTAVGGVKAPILFFGVFICALLSMGWLFKIGFRHSVDFPASTGPASVARKKMLRDVDIETVKDNQSILVDYRDNSYISASLNHYEDRFKIIDQGNLVVSIITGGSLVVLLVLLAEGSVGITPPSIVLIFFVGNILFRSIRQLSSFFVIISRLFQQALEVYVFFEKSTLPVETSASEDTSIDVLKSAIGDLARSQKVKLADADNVLVLCQHEPIGKLALYSFLLKCGVDPDKNDFSNVFVLEPDYVADFLGHLPRVKLRSLLKISDQNLPKSASDSTRDMYQAILAASDMPGAIILCPLDFANALSKRALLALTKHSQIGYVIFYGRAPRPGLKSGTGILKTTVLSGNTVEIYGSESVLALTGVELRKILEVKRGAVPEVEDLSMSLM